MKCSNDALNRETRRAIERYIRSLRIKSPKTEKKKIQYCEYLREYLESIGKSIKEINYKDLNGCVNFLEQKTHKGKQLAQTTLLSTLLEIYNFLEFLSHISGYKRAINYEIVQFFKLSSSEKRKLRGTVKKTKYYPTIDKIHQIIDSISSDTFLGKRLIALIVYLFLTGSRIEAATTLRIGLVDILKRMVFQDPQKGVKTKFGKYIETTIPNFDENLFEILIDWINELKSLGFGEDAPLFPKSKISKKENYLEFSESTSLDSEFLSPSTLSKDVKEACMNAGFKDFHCHSFRDSHIYYGLEASRNYLEIKAVSLNVGHESVETTIRYYSTLAPEEVHEIILKLGITNNEYGIPAELEETFKRFLKALNEEQYKKYYAE